MSVVLFMVLVKVSAIQKISVQNLAIMEMIANESPSRGREGDEAAAS